MNDNFEKFLMLIFDLSRKYHTTELYTILNEKNEIIDKVTFFKVICFFRNHSIYRVYESLNGLYIETNLDRYEILVIR